jgi:hypothetical protein
VHWAEDINPELDFGGFCVPESQPVDALGRVP